MAKSAWGLAKAGILCGENWYLLLDSLQYRSNLNYLIAKGLIEKKLEGSDLFYVVCSQGVESLSKMKSGYRQRLAALAEKSFPVVSKLSDKKIEEDIARKTDILLRRTGGEIDEN